MIIYTVIYLGYGLNAAHLNTALFSRETFLYIVSEVRQLMCYHCLPNVRFSNKIFQLSKKFIWSFNNSPSVAAYRGGNSKGDKTKGSVLPALFSSVLSMLQIILLVNFSCIFLIVIFGSLFLFHAVPMNSFDCTDKAARCAWGIRSGW